MWRRGRHQDRATFRDRPVFSQRAFVPASPTERSVQVIDPDLSDCFNILARQTDALHGTAHRRPPSACGYPRLTAHVRRGRSAPGGAKIDESACSPSGNPARRHDLGWGGPPSPARVMRTGQRHRHARRNQTKVLNHTDDFVIPCPPDKTDAAKQTMRRSMTPVGCCLNDKRPVL